MSGEAVGETSVVGLVRGADWWFGGHAGGVTVLSLALTIADWRSARAGAVVDAKILVALVARGVLLGAHA